MKLANLRLHSHESRLIEFAIEVYKSLEIESFTLKAIHLKNLKLNILKF